MRIFSKNWGSLTLLFSLSVGLFACQNSFNKEEIMVNTALDATRFFLEAALQGNKEQAQKYIIRDSLNDFLLNKWDKKFRQLSDSEKINYRKASIIIEKDSLLSDSSEIIRFSNSYHKRSYKIKAYKVAGEYKVDLKYMFYEDR